MSRSSRLLLGSWFPECSYRQYGRPEVGWTIAMAHAVWEITAVDDIPLNATDKKNWENWGTHRPGEEWRARPYKATARWVGGVQPDWVTPDKTEGTIVVRSDQSHNWNVYEGGRWPQCSCCGEPMPCRAAITDARVDHEMETLASFEDRVPGACWACREPISSRQQAVTYGGENLDLPGGPTAVFHVRKQCRHDAERYEERWLAKNPGQARMLTYPYCRGRLVTHNDGSSECQGGHPDCEGHATHDHGSISGCAFAGGGCLRGCDPTRSHIRHRKRPPVRDPNLPQSGHPRHRGLDMPFDDDEMRLPCPGTLVIHCDGSEECTAGGNDDCIGGSKYRHDIRRDCATLTYGCPRCEVAT